ncbi:MAG: hypothetical protein JXR81_07345 [Candidatus Goldbacteria bacterium]|nr:hypothetical protein [Candidatus Goldiibacteriota bacterium]
MCRFLEEEIDYSEAANEQGWVEKNRRVCALKRENCNKNGDQTDICCGFAETNSFAKCGNYRAQ